MLDEILLETEDKMNKAVESTKVRFSHIRAGRANVSMIDGVKVDYFGQSTPLNQVGSLSAPESRLIVIDPWDKSLIPAIEKEILKALLYFLQKRYNKHNKQRKYDRQCRAGSDGEHIVNVSR